MRTVSSVVLLVAVGLAGCLEEGVRQAPVVGDPSPEVNADMNSMFARASGALEADGADTATRETDLLLCADAAYSCFETPEADPSACIDTYIACALNAGVSADNAYLVCLGTFSGCWSAAETTEAADLCLVDYDGCVAVIEPEPVDEGDDGDDVVDGDPTDEGDHGETPVEACAYAADDCLMALSETDGPGQAACVSSYSQCLLDAGVSAEEPYLGCLAETTSCLNEGTHAADTCWYFFEVCYDENYPADHGTDPDPDDDHGTPDDSWGESPCEQETMACYDEGGSNVTCLGVLRSCLVDSGVPEDHPYIACLDPLIECAGPAETGADPDASLEQCSDTFNQCVESSAR